MIRNAVIGGGIWLAIVLAGQISGRFGRSWIELLLLFAPMVIVPLGLEVTRQLDSESRARSPEKLAGRIQLPAALAAAFSFYSGSQFVTAGLAALWLAFATILAAGRVWRIFRTRSRSFGELSALLAFVYLVVGAAWFVASRLRWHPMDFREPIVLLTAVHFHYAGFAAAILVRALWDNLKRGLVRSLLFPVAALGALSGPALLAAGFVIGPTLKLIAALLVALGEIALAACFATALPGTTQASARILLFVSAASVALAMCLAALWALGEFPRQPFLDIARMAAWHGSLNAFGFTFCGLTAFACCQPTWRFGKGRTI
ncbi:MAG: YndJ family protein [Candidatus Acidiferrales bacterium]